MITKGGTYIIWPEFHSGLREHLGSCDFIRDSNFNEIGFILSISKDNSEKAYIIKIIEKRRKEVTLELS